MGNWEVEILDKLDSLRCKSIQTYIDLRDKLRKHQQDQATELELRKSLESWVTADRAVDIFREKHVSLLPKLVHVTSDYGVN